MCIYVVTVVSKDVVFIECCSASTFRRCELGDFRRLELLGLIVAKPEHTGATSIGSKLFLYMQTRDILVH